MPSDKLRIVPLGGLGEVGKNMMVLEYGDEALLIDAGIMFPENDMLGIDYIIPDFRYLRAKAHTVKGIIITHGHEDHTGAIAHVMETFDVPIYTTRLTRGLLENKLRHAHLLDQVTIHTFQAGDEIGIGPFRVETFHVCHSIPDGVGLGIDTPVGLVVHSGDFKFDHTPVDGWPPDFAKLAEFSRHGVLALLSDSTNADRPGWTPSEAVVADALDAVFRQAKGRIIVATFASLISRIQQVAHIASRHGRKMAIAGRTMAENVRIARQLGYLDVPDGLLVSLDQISSMKPSQVVVMATGTQGEPSAVVGRLAVGRHRQLEVQPDDTIIMSSHPIPGNEEMVHRIINRLFQRGADVIYSPVARVHVSGHASQEEHKLLLNLVRPKFFVPIHGELRHLKQHARMAEQVGIPPENIAVVENGTVLEFDSHTMTVGERVAGGYVFVDGAIVGDVGPAVMRDREDLARDGFLLVMVNVDRKSDAILGEPEVVSRGFVFMRDAAALMLQVHQTIRQAMTDCPPKERENCLQTELSRMLYQETRRRPMVFAVVNEV
jgi:ribonuclease J